MPFTWYHVRSNDLTNAPAVAKEAYEREMSERAALLQRLGYAIEEAKARVRANVRWDFELHDQPGHLERVDEIVERVYARHGAGAGAPTL